MKCTSSSSKWENTALRWAYKLNTAPARTKNGIEEGLTFIFLTALYIHKHHTIQLQQLVIMAYRRYRKWEVNETVPMRKFGYQGAEVTGQWRKLHNVELYNLYTSPIGGTALQAGRSQV